MHYLIDGYNLLFCVGQLTPNRPANLEPVRTELLRMLQTRFPAGGDPVTVVFDARRAPPTVKERNEYHGIEVLVTRDEEADDLIERVIKQAASPKRLGVVSDDHRLIRAARRRGCATIETAAFYEMLLTPAPAKRPRPAADPERPSLSADEVQVWMKEFGELEQDAGFRELFEPPTK
jgi:predicted RNA-binding protein with PIN domain